MKGAAGAGEARDIVFNWNTQTFTPGEFLQIFAVADSGNAVEEFDETNNASSQVVQAPLPSAGDLNADGLVTTADIDAFVAVLLGLDVDPYHRAAADTDGNGVPNGADVRPFVTLLLGP